MRIHFSELESIHKDDPDWEKIIELQQQLISFEQRSFNKAHNSIDRLLRSLKLVGIKQDCINEPYFLWMLESIANKNIWKVPIFRPIPIEKSIEIISLYFRLP